MLTAGRRRAGETDRPGDADELEPAPRISRDDGAGDAERARRDEERCPEVGDAVAGPRSPLPAPEVRGAEVVRASDRAVEELGLQEGEVVGARGRQDRDG